MMKFFRYVSIIFFLFLFSCSSDDESDSNENLFPDRAGVVITFDDDYIDEWYNVQHVLQPYEWKATFFITKFHLLNNVQIEKLHSLKNSGHEIGGHGLNHLNAPTFVQNYSIAAYLTEEIDPMLQVMRQNQFNPISFAYPYGARNETTDNALLTKFDILRGTTYGAIPPPSQRCYYNNSQIVYALGIDNNYSHFSISYFISLLEYAKRYHKIIIFYAHKPVVTAYADYQTEYQTLIAICQYVQSHNMKFYTMSELTTLNL